MCVCLEVDCGVPVSLPHSVVLWNNSSSLGSVALYVCEAGYRTVGEGNVSLCNSDAKWSKVNMRCEGTDNILSSFTYLCVIQNIYDFFSFVERNISAALHFKVIIHSFSRK